ncbi:hypothetical protein FCV82_02480 [Vibrio breoganii]|uniref:DNA-binding protein n=1 Tax=Vibrio breoganii TaxID=553239 RepID=UPI000C8576E7|nr:DNA-binding protein [Vibrio breoganii]PMN72719.1 hypothetical protein BCT28_16850 [Vibrio breoganii]PMO77932.1 hypothetical protein BCT00_18000 [Vibrio breoganii]TKF90455.1 hypothetical protein FCV82_02480 [Vibrio breoganii]
MMSNNMQERVTDYCNELYAKGEKVTVRMILAHFDEFESSSTAHKYYRHWKAEMEANEKSLYDKLGFSADFTQIFMKEISRFSAEAEQRYKQMRDDAVEQCDLAIQDLTRAEDRYEKQSALVQQQNKEITELREQLKSSEAKHFADMDKQAETNAVLVNELRQQIEKLETEADSSIKTIENLRTDHAKSELVLESNKEFVEEARERQNHLQTENKELTTAVATLTAQLEGAKELNTSIQSRLDDYSSTKAELETQLSQIKTEKAGTETKLSELNVELNTSRAATESLNARLGSLEEVNNQRERYITELESKLEPQQRE